MNIKAWNIKKGLKRIWIIGSVFVPFILMNTDVVMIARLTGSMVRESY